MSPDLRRNGVQRQIIYDNRIKIYLDTRSTITVLIAISFIDGKGFFGFETETKSHLTP